jgi:serine/threonine protein phosphatase PrpC
MKISPPQSLNEIGQRHNNEDSIYPPKGAATATQHFFLVCDGMGGHENGEVASSTVCESFASSLINVKPEAFNKEVFENALSFAYDELDKKDSGEGKKMGTTLTFLYLNNKQAFMAHIGDSRIYHLRKNESGKVEIIHKSSDHSLVNELLQSGIITEEEAANHPKKNVITRAMQPHLEKPCKADVHITQDVRAGDYFFLCTDGVLESVSDKQLRSFIAENETSEAMIQAINDLCVEHSRDNFSAYLIPVIEGIASTEEENITVVEEEEEIATAVAITDPPKEKEEVMAPQKTAPSKSDYSAPPPPKKKSKAGSILLILILLFAIAIAAFLFLKKEKELETAPTTTQPSTPAQQQKPSKTTPVTLIPEEKDDEISQPDEPTANFTQEPKNKPNPSNKLQEQMNKAKGKEKKEGVEEGNKE